jgi:hypothetical protein
MNGVRIHRRAAIAAFAVTAVAGGALLAQRSLSLYVFVPSVVRSRALVDLLEAALPGVEVVAFGRFADFMSAVKTMGPSAAMSLSDALSSVGLKADVRGIGPGGALEPYVILINHPELNLQNLGEHQLGVVDVVGRRALPGMVRTMLGLSAEPKLRRVLKVGDLLPLLSVNLAEGIIVPERLASELIDASRLDLRTLRPPGARLGRTALAYPGGESIPLIQKGLMRLSQTALQALGVEGWEVQK